MKVTKAQAQANRAHIVETASALFRERGYDGVGIADLMAAAGFTQGGFYRHFASKADLMAEAAACGLARSTSGTERIDPKAFVSDYVSRKHRDALGKGCTMAALCGDAARQPAPVKAVFEAGIENMLASLAKPADASAEGDARADSREMTIALMAQVVGALVLSRACPDDSPLADEILEVCRTAMLARLSGDDARHQPASH